MSKLDRPQTLESQSPTLSVVVVNYNAGDLLAECVAAVLGSSVEVEVVISDNGSSDLSLARMAARFGDDPRVTVVENGTNLGFAAGNNRVLAHASAPYLLFLNPDCIVRADTLRRVLEFMESNPSAGMAGCTIRNPDGSEQSASRRAIPDPWIAVVRVLRLYRTFPGLAAARRLTLTDAPLPDRALPVDAISGSFMMVRRKALVAVGPLDEGYFLHCEDLDWFVRFKQAGWPIYLVPNAQAIHHKGACSTGQPLRVEWHKHRGMARFFCKFQLRDYPLPIGILVLAGLWAHFVACAMVIPLSRLMPRAFRDAWR